MEQRLKEKYVLITGASGGIGTAAATLLARAGYKVFAGARHPERLNDLVRQSSGKIIPVKLDVTDMASLAEAVRCVRETVKDSGLFALINNAGFILQGPLELLPANEINHQFDVNVLGQIRVTQAFLPLIRVASGRVINIGAMTGKTAMPYLGALSASKQAMEAITDALRIELKPWKIQVIMIEPAAMKTQIFDKARTSSDIAIQKVSADRKALYRDALKLMEQSTENQPLNPPETVAKTIIRALTANRPRTRYAVGRGARLLLALGYLPDRWRDRLLIRALGLHKLSANKK